MVIVVHTSSLSKSPYNLAVAWPFILSFAFAKTCVPLFVMLSGALLLGKTEAYGAFFKKRIKKVLVPWIVWTFIYMFWNYNFNHYVASTVSQWKYFFELTFLSQLWFLPLIFSLYLITPLLRAMISKFKTADSKYFLLLWFIWVSVLPFLHPSPALPQPSAAGLLSLAVYYSGYFFLGFTLTKLKFSKKRIMFPFTITVIGIAISLIEIFLIKNITTYPSIVFDYFAPGIVITSIGLFLLISHLFTKTISIKSNKLNSIIILLSSASLGIYIVHSLFMQIFDAPLQKYFLVNFATVPILEIYLHALIIFVLSFGLVYLLKRIPLVRQIVP